VAKPSGSALFQSAEDSVLVDIGDLITQTENSWPSGSDSEQDDFAEDDDDEDHNVRESGASVEAATDDQPEVRESAAQWANSTDPIVEGSVEDWLHRAAMGDLSATHLVFGADFSDVVAFFAELAFAKSSAGNGSSFLSADWVTYVSAVVLRAQRLAVGVSPLAHRVLQPWESELWSSLRAGLRKVRRRPPAMQANVDLRPLLRVLERVPPPPEDPSEWSIVDQIRWRQVCVTLVRMHTGSRSGDLAYALASHTLEHAHAVTGQHGLSILLVSHKTAAAGVSPDYSRKLWLEPDLSGDRPWFDPVRALGRYWLPRRRWLVVNGLWSGPPNSLFGVSASSLAKDAKRLLGAAGLGRMRSHELRGSVFSLVTALGNPFLDAKLAFGWADPASAQVRRNYERSDKHGQLVHGAIQALPDASRDALGSFVQFDSSRAHEACATCGLRLSLRDTRDRMVLCSTADCVLGEHLACAGLSRVPRGNWFCRVCVLSGIEQVECESLLESFSSFAVSARGRSAVSPDSASTRSVGSPVRSRAGRAVRPKAPFSPS
jgi:hypothetical protein